ncbi:unnamed protein product, partial [Ectocarpus sp. 12 AP-2014]
LRGRFARRTNPKDVDDLALARERINTRELDNALSHDHHSRRLRLAHVFDIFPLLVAAPGSGETSTRRCSFVGSCRISDFHVAP